MGVMGGRGRRGGGWLPAEKATVTGERREGMCISIEEGLKKKKKEKKITRWNKCERRGISSPPPSTSLIKGSMMMVIDIHHSALISRSKIMHLTSVSKLHPRLFFCFFFLTFLSFFFCYASEAGAPLCERAECVRCRGAVHNEGVFMLTNQFGA